MSYNSEKTESLFMRYLESKEDYCGIIPCCEVEDVEEISEDSVEDIRSDAETIQCVGTNVRELPDELPPSWKVKRQKIEQSLINSPLSANLPKDQTQSDH